MEAVKGVVFDKGVDEWGGKQVHKYLVCFLLVTDTPLTNLSRVGETVIMGTNNLPTNDLTSAVEGVLKFQPPTEWGE